MQCEQIRLKLAIRGPVAVSDSFICLPVFQAMLITYRSPDRRVHDNRAESQSVLIHFVFQSVSIDAEEFGGFCLIAIKLAESA
jgi:hypothetical protein